MRRASVPRHQRWSAAGAVAVVLGAVASGVVLSARASAGGWMWFWETLVWTVPVLTFTTVGFLLVVRGAGWVIAGLCLAFGLAWGVTGAIDAATRFVVSGAGSIVQLDLIFALAFPLWVREWP